jgi:hypothetical protein
MVEYCGKCLVNARRTMRRRSCCYSPPGLGLDRRRRRLLPPSLLVGGHPLLPSSFWCSISSSSCRSWSASPSSCRHIGGGCWASGKAGRSAKVVDGWWLVLNWCRQCRRPICCCRRPCFRGRRLSSRVPGLRLRPSVVSVVAVGVCGSSSQARRVVVR